MIAALLYLQVHSVKNRLQRQLKRLKRPSYAIFALVGAFYFYFYFFRFVFGGRHPQTGWDAAAPEQLALYESLGACALLVVMLFAWIFPHERAALAFTEAEVAFLFPAPINRRGLIHFKLLRSQAAILFTTLFLTLLSHRFGAAGWIRAASWWILLSTVNLHLIGSSFARTMLLDRGITNWQRRVGILAIVGVLGTLVVFWAGRTVPAPEAAELGDLDRARQYFEHAVASGPAPYVLYPFRLMARPYLAVDGATFLAAAWPALLILLLHYVWVVRSDVAFEEASVEASRRLAERIAAVRAGNWQSPGRIAKPRRAPFALGATGFPSTALLWKNLIQAGQSFTLQTWILVLTIAIALSIWLRESASRSGVLAAIGVLVLILLTWSLFFGPHLLRQDFRQDLRRMDMLKLFPVPGWQVVLGELLAPAIILTAVQWCLLIVAIGFSPHMQTNVNWPLVASCGFGAALILPMLDMILLVIPNAAVLVFPAWFQIGDVRGIEATGQRLTFLLGELVIFAVGMVPAAFAFMLAFFPIRFATGLATAVAVGSIAAGAVLAAEITLSVMLLGRVFERFDLSAEMEN